MTLTPVKPHTRQTDVDPALLETHVGVMVEGPYEWREYCDKDSATVLLRNPEKKHRTISLYEILTAYRPYRCAHCKRMLWNPDVKEDV